MSDTGMILQRVGAKLVSDVAPKLEGDYSGGHASIAGVMTAMAGEMWEKEADNLVNEIAGLRALVSAGGAAATVPEATSFRISELKATRDALAAQLIELQASLESRDDGEAAALNTQIWGHLLATCVARMPSPPAFDAGEPDQS